MARPVRVAFDATACLGPRTGIGRYTTEVLDHLGDDPDLALTIFAVTWRGRDRLDQIAPAGSRVVDRPLPARPAHWAWARFGRPTIEHWTGACDVVHGPNYVVPPTRDAATIVTVHDLTPVRFPELADAHTRTFPGLIDRAVRAGAWVHTSSQFVADEVVRHFPVDPDRVVVVAGGVTPLPPPGPGSDIDTGRLLAGGDRFVLGLGTVEPRKDLPALVAAFDRLAASDSDLRLVIAGAEGWGSAALDSAVASAGRPDRIVRLGRIDENQRAALLRAASVLAYPSRYEGFGLPPLEAMDAGTPVICTDAGSLPEVVGDAAVVINAEALRSDRPTGIGQLADGIERMLDDAEHRADLIERGHRRAAAFRWSDAARGIAELYRRAAAEVE